MPEGPGCQSWRPAGLRLSPSPLLPARYMATTLLWLCHSGPIPNCLVVGPSPLRLDKDKVMEKAGISKELKKLQEYDTGCTWDNA